MKKLAYMSLILTSLAFASAPSEEDAKPKAGEIEKAGFLTTEACAKKGEFVDCNLQTVGNSPFVLYIHDEDIAYKLDTSNTSSYTLYEDVGKNGGKVIGVLTAKDAIKVRTYVPAPPETKSFFKGCM